jgi:hypothetical protein
MFFHLSGRHRCILDRMLDGLLLSPDLGLLLAIWIGLFGRLWLLALYGVDADRIHSCVLVNTSSAMLGMRGAV